MKFRWPANHFKVIIVLSLAFGLTGEAEGNGARSNPVLTTHEIRTSGPRLPHNFESLTFTVFTSRTGAFSFEAPETWRTPQDSHASMLEALLVGPIDTTRRIGALITVSRQPRVGNADSLESLIDQLRRKKLGQIITDETAVIDLHPARILRIHEHVSVPIWTQEYVVQVVVVLCARIALIENTSEIYVVEYISSPELYEAYLPVFEYVVKSFRVHHDGGTS